jgi:hypothetical protein
MNKWMNRWMNDIPEVSRSRMKMKSQCQEWLVIERQVSIECDNLFKEVQNSMNINSCHWWNWEYKFTIWMLTIENFRFIWTILTDCVRAIFVEFRIYLHSPQSKFLFIFHSFFIHFGFLFTFVCVSLSFRVRFRFRFRSLISLQIIQSWER